MPKGHVSPLDTHDASLEVVGGKGKSLATMACAGMDVPTGFYVTTSAYREYVADNNLQTAILEMVKPEISGRISSFDSASTGIQTLFDQARLRDETIAEICKAYTALEGDDPAVAVRSSANAEDLPDMSFAGQQDTYLNVRGEKALIEAIHSCWASLWTPRAINYRHEMGIEQDAVAMAVVVQIMVPSDVSGILFTANPATGDRAEMIVNASFGLGEAVVGGYVAADTFIVDRDSLSLKETMIGAKEQKIVSDNEQGTRVEDIAEGERDRSSLSDAELKALATLAIQVQELFGGMPLDIEWAIYNDKLWLLQARAITNLPPPPLTDVRWEPSEPGSLLMRNQVVEFMPGPLSSLFEELYIPAVDEGFALRRDWLDGTTDGLARAAKARRHGNETVNGYAYRYFGPAKPKKPAVPLPAPKEKQVSIHALSSVCHEWPRRWRHDKLPVYLATIRHWHQLKVDSASDEKLLDGICKLTRADGHYWEAANSVLAVPRWQDQALQNFLQKHAPDAGFTSGMLLDAVDSKTMQAQMDLWAIVRQIQSNDALNELVVATPAQGILAALQAHEQGHEVVKALNLYLGRYGHQIYSLDYAEPTPTQDPTPVLSALKTQVQDKAYDPIAHLAQVNTRRREALQEITQHFTGKLRWQFRWRLFWAQRFYANRDEGQFYVGAAWPVLQRMALELGQRLVKVGTFKNADDVYYLKSKELLEAIEARKQGESIPALLQKTIERRELREARKRLTPPEKILPPSPDDKTSAANDNTSAQDNMNQGTAVSPGKITAEVSVIHSAADFDRMIPNSILVCPFTTPAWTQLFSHAVGLVTDIGSITSHGSIVAREYGIPAVLGLGDISKRLVSGQVITIDGDAGTVTIEEGSAQGLGLVKPGPAKPAAMREPPAFGALDTPFPFKISKRERLLGLIARPFKAAFYRSIVAVVFLISGPRPML
jgi:pyruvate,water dikinase